MRTFGIIGYPLSHSFSQKYFTQKFGQEGIADAVFNNYPIETIEALHDVIANEPTLKGLAVTIPYKKQVLPYLASATEAVQQMGACNCIKVSGGGLYGFNTDVIGFERSFVPHLQPHHTHALVLGTGGASAAVVFVLQKLGIDYTLVSRQAAAAGIISYEQTADYLAGAYTVVINCTPLGTYPDTETAPAIPYQLVTPKHYLFDLVYNPPLTKFLALGKAQGATIKNGYDMLTLQAEENWTIWNR